MLMLNAVEKSFGTLKALGPLNLRVEEGQCLVLVGPSGCGKSTLVRILVGLSKPDRGTYEIAGVPVSLKPGSGFHRKIGYVTQRGGLFPHLTARQNMALIAQGQGVSVAATEKRLLELAALCHFPIDRLNHYPVQLSGGEKQRVALVRALMLDPKIVVLDEPLGALDPMIRVTLRKELRDLFKVLKKTVVLVTHDMQEAAYFGDQIAIMRSGAIIQQGDYETLKSRPVQDFVRNFLSASSPGSGMS